jgi:hypothetical protein
MKQLLNVVGLAMTFFALPATAQSAAIQSPAVRLEQLAVGIRVPSPTNRDAVVGFLNPVSSATIVRESARSDSSGRSAVQNIAIGAAIGGAIGIAAGALAPPMKKTSSEVDIGRTGYMLLGFVSGAIVGSLVGALAHFGQ